MARWTDLGKDVRYLLVTRGEAGIATMPPEVVGPIREQEHGVVAQRSVCRSSSSSIIVMGSSRPASPSDEIWPREFAGTSRR